MKQTFIFVVFTAVTIALCVARMIWAPGTFGIELFAIPAIFAWGVSLIRKVEE